jgi:two-component system response regulator VicR
MSNPGDIGLPVLIVDDDPFIRDFLSDVLEDAGYTVLTAADGRAALALLRRQPVALVVTDLMMPYVNGIDLFRQLRAEPATAELPVIVMSAAYAGAQGTPFTTFLPKPFEIETLLEVIGRFYAAS